MAIEVFEIAARIDLKSNAIKVIEDLAKQFEALDKLTKDVQSSLGRVAEELKRLGEGNAELKGLGRSVGSIAKAFDTVGKSSTEAAAGIEKIADATRDAVSAGRRLGRIYSENADLARAAARATAGTSRGAAGSVPPAGRASRSGHGGMGFNHQLMEAGIGAQMSGEPLVHLSKSAFEEGMERAQHIYMLRADQRVRNDPTALAGADEAVRKARAGAPGTSISGNYKQLVDLKQVGGSLAAGEAILPSVARLSSILQIVDEKHGGEGDAGFAAAKALDLMGEMTVESRDPTTGKLKQELKPELLAQKMEEIARVAVAYGGRVDPHDYIAAAKTGEIPLMTADEKFKYRDLPAMILTMGASRVGTALQAQSQVITGGRLMPKYYEALVQMGWAEPGGVHMERDPVTHKKREVVDTSKIYDYDLMKRNLVDYVAAGLERMAKRGITGIDEQIERIQKSSQRSTQARALAEIAKDLLGIRREEVNTENTTPEEMLNSPKASFNDFKAAWKDLMGTLGMSAMGDTISAMKAITSELKSLEAWAHANPDLARKVVDGVEIAGAALVGAGGLTMALWAISGPAKIAKAAIDAVGAAFGGVRAAPSLPGVAAGGPGRTARGALAIGGIASIAVLGFELAELAHQADEAVPALRKLDDAFRDWMRGMLSTIGSAFKNFGKFDGGQPSNDLGLPGLPSGDLGAGVGATTGNRSAVRLAPPSGNPLHIGLSSASNTGLGSSLERLLGFGGHAPSSVATTSGSILSGADGRGITDMGGAIGDKSAQAVKDKLDPHVIGSEIGNIAAATIRAAISSLQINVDGQQFGRVVDRSRDQQAQRPPTGPSLPDVRLGPLFPAHAS